MGSDGRWLTRWFYGLVVLSSAAGGNRRSHDVRARRADVTKQPDDVSTESGCVRMMEKVYRAQTVTPAPPNIVGEWTSTRCEVRPGPEFLLRRYVFYNDTEFEAYQFYYLDPSCHHPSHTMVAYGNYRVDRPSWSVPGGTELDYRLRRVTLTPYTLKAAALLGTRVNRTCSGFVKSPWKPYHRYDVFHFVEVDDNYHNNRMKKKANRASRRRGSDYGDVRRLHGDDYVVDDENSYVIVDRDCLAGLDWTLHELQLIRLEQSASRHRPHSSLFLGDIHTDRRQRLLYRPTAFQQPLTPSKTPSCHVCEALAGATEDEPPTLHRKPPPPLDLPGSWFSVRCEARPYGSFLTRQLSFSDNNHSWEGYYHHFADERCTENLFTIYVRGIYFAGPDSALIRDAHNFDFKVTQVKVRPKDMRIVRSLNSQEMTSPGKCGSKGVWELDAEQDVTATRGCVALAIDVPHDEYEILKLEKEHHKIYLFLGQRPSEGGDPTSPGMRPTSFQAPLIRCSDDIVPVTPPIEFHAARHAVTGAASSQQQCVSTLVLILFAFTSVYNNT